jgi:hypothetical protein
MTLKDPPALLIDERYGLLNEAVVYLDSRVVLPFCRDRDSLRSVGMEGILGVCGVVMSYVIFYGPVGLGCHLAMLVFLR